MPTYTEYLDSIVEAAQKLRELEPVARGQVEWFQRDMNEALAQVDIDLWQTVESLENPES